VGRCRRCLCPNLFRPTPPLLPFFDPDFLRASQVHPFFPKVDSPVTARTIPPPPPPPPATATSSVIVMSCLSASRIASTLRRAKETARKSCLRAALKQRCRATPTLSRFCPALPPSPPPFFRLCFVVFLMHAAPSGRAAPRHNHFLPVEPLDGGLIGTQPHFFNSNEKPTFIA